MSQPHDLRRRHALLGALALAGFPALRPLLAATPAQTEGPFFPVGEPVEADFDLTRLAGHAESAAGRVVEIHGVVRGGDGAPLAGAVVHVWQANHHGRYAHSADRNPAPLDPHFQGYAKLLTGADGEWRVKTIVPGPYPVGAGWSRPPHVHFKVSHPGHRELATQMYFAGDPLNDSDRILGALSPAEQAQVVVDFGTLDAAGIPLGRFDLALDRVG
jgi:protocatechuate 3,4-dioxygenase beta subunit